MGYNSVADYTAYGHFGPWSLRSSVISVLQKRAKMRTELARSLDQTAPQKHRSARRRNIVQAAQYKLG